MVQEGTPGKGLRPQDIVLPEADQLVQAESRAWGEKVPPPPPELFDVLRRSIEAGITVFEPHAVVVRDDNDKVKDIYWILIDSTPKPDFVDGRQLYLDDPFAGILETLRKSKKIDTYKYTNQDQKEAINPASRFGISAVELYAHFFPELTKISDKKSRLPTLYEFVMVGALFYPEWERTSTREWLHEAIIRGWNTVHPVGGDSKLGGFNDVDEEWEYFRSREIGFRPVISFETPKAA